MMDGVERTITREGYCMMGYTTKSLWCVERALSHDWVKMDDGTIFNRNQIVSYSTETVTHMVEYND